MQIGSVNMIPTAALAPMAGVGDRAFRETCVAQGAAYVIGEMCSAKGLTYNSEKSKELLYTSKEEQPAAVQIFGHQPDIMAQAVTIAQQFNPLIIDINMGCPAPKIVGDGGGCRLMRDMNLAYKVLEAAVKASSVPVTVKFRKGWSSEEINAVEFAKMAQSAGVAAMAIHGRTKEQMYAPPVDLDIIKAVKEAVTVPVLGNGGIESPQDAKAMMDYTGCDMVMVGQGALGRPWLFNQIKAYLLEGILLPDPSLEEKMDILYRHIEKAVAYKGEFIALKEARSHTGWYMKGLWGAAGYRRQSSKLERLTDLKEFIQLVLSENKEQRDKTTEEPF